MTSPADTEHPAPRPRVLLLLAGLVVVLAVAVVAAVAGDDGSSSDPGGAGSTTGPDPIPSTTGGPSTTATTTSTTTSSTTTTTTTTTVPPGPDLGALSARDLAYGLVVTGITGTDGPTRLREVVGSACVGGVFVTESNGNWTPESDAAAASAAIAALGDAAAADGCETGPLVATDAELGPIVRVPVESPAAAPTWADRYAANPYDTATALHDEVFAYATALRGLGVDVNFGVVADVDTAPGNFMARSGRTFGDDQTITAALTATMVDAHCVAGVAATLKHFPNQGATVEDPHRERSVAVGGLEDWYDNGRLPYVNTAAPLVMTGHIFVAEDPQWPASLSGLLTSKELRGELAYDGVVVTDDLSTMRGAIDVIADAGGRAVAAVDAGADLVLYARDTDVAAVVDALTARIEADPSFAEQAGRAYTRVWNLKAALGAVPGEDPADHPLCP